MPLPAWILFGVLLAIVITASACLLLSLWRHR